MPLLWFLYDAKTPTETEDTPVWSYVLSTPQSLLDAVLAGTTETTPVKTLGLTGRAEVTLDNSHCVQLIDRKSRFLRKDAERFVATLGAARNYTNQALKGCVVIRQAPVCSQARAWLESQGIDVITD